MLRIWPALVMAVAAWGQPQPGGNVEMVERIAGPFRIQDRDYRVKLLAARLQSGESPETVVALEILDAAGAIQWERKLSYRVEGSRFEETTSVEVEPLKGRKGQGLLVSFRVSPSVPVGGRSWQVLGVVDGKLAAFGKPVTVEGMLAEQESGKPAVASWDEALLADVLNFRVWTGRLFAIVPVSVNWEMGRLRPAYFVEKCRWNIEAKRPRIEIPGSVRLFPRPDELAESGEVAVRRDSQVEFVSAEGAVVWEESDEHIWLSVSERLWIHVRIDGQQGWVHSPEDLDALGLREEG